MRQAVTAPFPSSIWVCCSPYHRHTRPLPDLCVYISQPHPPSVFSPLPSFLPPRSLPASTDFPDIVTLGCLFCFTSSLPSSLVPILAYLSGRLHRNTAIRLTALLLGLGPPPVITNTSRLPFIYPPKVLCGFSSTLAGFPWQPKASYNVCDHLHFSTLHYILTSASVLTIRPLASHIQFSAPRQTWLPAAHNYKRRRLLLYASTSSLNYNEHSGYRPHQRKLEDFFTQRWST